MPRTESREVWPYAHSPNAFDGMALRFDPNGTFEPTQSTFILDPEAGLAEQDQLTLEVQLDFDVDALLDEVALTAADVDLTVTVEHPYARSAVVVHRWPIASSPRRCAAVLGPQDYSAGELSLRVAAILNRRQKRAAVGRAWRAGALLAERTFSIHLPRTASLFNVENTSFKERQWDPNALWYVRFRDLPAAPEARPEEVVEVHLNKDLEALQFLWSPGATRRGPAIRVGANMVRQLIASEILAEIAVAVLADFRRVRRDDPEAEPADLSLTKAVINALSELSLPTDGLLDLATEDPGELRRRIQHMMGVGRSFGAQPYRDWYQSQAERGSA